MDNLEQNLKAISKALAMMTAFLYETDTELRDVMAISDEKYDNNNESLFYSCYYRNIKTFDDLYNRWKTSECTALMARAIRCVLEQKEDDKPTKDADKFWLTESGYFVPDKHNSKLQRRTYTKILENLSNQGFIGILEEKWLSMFGELKYKQM